MYTTLPERETVPLSELYSKMLWIRMVEEAIAERYQQQEMRCPVHLSIGQEGAAVSVCAALRPEDQIFSTHRCHAHYLAKGGDLFRMLAELHGRQSGCCAGRGGSMHLMDEKAGVAASIPIVGANIPLAVGAALAFRQQGRESCSVAFLGDGAAEEGVFHESLNFASTHRLPILFVLENNLYSVYTNLGQRQPDSSLSRFALAHSLKWAEADSADVENSHRVVLELLRGIDAGEGPALLVLDTYRYHAHCGPEVDDDLGYRSRSEVDERRKRCPLKWARQIMTDRGNWSQMDAERTKRNFQSRIDTAFSEAVESPFPKADSAGDFIYAPSKSLCEVLHAD